ncbi:GspH/FimT family pseudopilin [Microbulbifer sp. CnH-101-G]|uniref:GspH/FimT family pseudopilin n=1 Tax=Microbulbifer sp. CnH-101-G TaxID=3243393 RepID=UPI004039E240
MRYKQVQHKHYFRQRGFTLVELMVTLMVMAILVSIAMPSFTNSINNNRSIALSEEFIGALSYARSEAVKRGAAVSICASTDGASCTAADTWSQGWIVFVDVAVDDNTIPPNVGAVLRSWEADENAVITVEQGAATNFIRYTSLGTLGRFNQTTINSKVSGCTTNSARTIMVSGSGIATVSKVSC